MRSGDPRTPTPPPVLRNERDWFRLMANDPHTPESDRAVWKMLADELDSYFAARYGDQLELW